MRCFHSFIFNLHRPNFLFYSFFPFWPSSIFSPFSRIFLLNRVLVAGWVGVVSRCKKYWMSVLLKGQLSGFNLDKPLSIAIAFPWGGSAGLANGWSFLLLPEYPPGSNVNLSSKKTVFQNFIIVNYRMCHSQFWPQFKLSPPTNNSDLFVFEFLCYLLSHYPLPLPTRLHFLIPWNQPTGILNCPSVSTLDFTIPLRLSRSTRFYFYIYLKILFDSVNIAPQYLQVECACGGKVASCMRVD